MIGYIKGRVTALFKDFCFLETGGIGYRIFISDKTRQQLMTKRVLLSRTRSSR